MVNIKTVEGCSLPHLGLQTHYRHAGWSLSMCDMGTWVLYMHGQHWEHISQPLAFFLCVSGYQEKCRKPSWLPCHGPGWGMASVHVIDLPGIPQTFACHLSAGATSMALLALFPLKRSPKDSNRPTGAPGRKAGLLAGPLERSLMLSWGS